MSPASPKTPISLWLPPILAVALVALVFLLRSNQKKEVENSTEKYQKHFSGIMGTEANFIIIPDKAMTVSAQDAADEAFKAAKYIEKLMNAYSETSDISRINRAAPGVEVPVSPLTWSVIEQSLRFNYISEGAFNPLMGRLIKLYKWGNAKVKQLPAEEKILSALQSTKLSNLKLKREGMLVSRTNADTLLDLGGIAKGMGVDAAANKLIELGVKNAIVEIGGEVRLIGHAPQSSGVNDLIGNPDTPWHAGIRDPRGNGTIMTLEEKGDCAIATSGDYEKFFEIGDKRYSHIIDPRTGLPVSGGVISATVIYPGSCLEADALATSACVLGVEKFTKLLNLFPSTREVQTRAILILEDGSRVEVKSELYKTIKKHFIKPQPENSNPPAAPDENKPDTPPHTFAFNHRDTL